MPKFVGRPKKVKGNRREYKVWLDPEVVKAAKLVSLVLEIDYPLILEEALLIGLAVINKAKQMGTVDWNDSVRMPRISDLKGNLASLKDTDVDHLEDIVEPPL